jgi:hypothetical protein
MKNQSLIDRIARENLLIDTLTERKHDDLDFHEVAVWNVRQALERAYAAGLDAGRRVAARS